MCTCMISFAVSPSDRQRLEAIVHVRAVRRMHVWRARIVLLSAAGVGANTIMRETGKAKTVVWRWQERFLAKGVDGLLCGKTRPPGKPPPAPPPQGTIDRVLARTLAPPPHGAIQWTGRVIAEAVSLAVSTVQSICRAHGLAPHRFRQFKLSRERAFADKQRAAIGRNIQRHRYRRHKLDRFLNADNRTLAADREAHVILGHYVTYWHEKLHAWAVRHPNWHSHFTPTSCSWLNAVEGFFSKLSRRRLQRGVLHSLADLQVNINRFINEHNRSLKPFTWTADPNGIIAAEKRGQQALEAIH